MGCLISQRDIWGYYVCLCPIKRMPGLYELIGKLVVRWSICQFRSFCRQTSSSTSQSTDRHGKVYAKLYTIKFSYRKHQQRETREKRSFGFPTWSDTNRSVQLQEMARCLKFPIWEEELYYPCSENKGATAKLISAFVSALANIRSSHDPAQIVNCAKNVTRIKKNILLPEKEVVDDAILMLEVSSRDPALPMKCRFGISTLCSSKSASSLTSSVGALYWI